MAEPDGTVLDASAEELATRVDRPRAISLVPADDPGPLPRGDSSVTVTTPEGAIRNDEVERYRRLGFPALATMITGLLIAMPFLPGDRVARWMFSGGLTIYGLGVVWFRLKIRDPRQYRDANLLVPGITGAIAAFGGVYYWGAFSPAPIVVAAILFVNSMDGGLRHTAVVYGLCAAAQLTIAIAIMTGAIPDGGLIRADDATLLTQVFTQGAIQGALLLGFVGGRTLRRVTLESLVRLDRAAREATKREALIDEIRHELRRAARVNVAGRFTDQVLGSFRLGLVIGRGGMGEVYEARHVTNDTPAAVKLLLVSHLGDPDHLERFAREARAAEAIRSPHVVRILEVSRGEIPYIAMELLVGSSLSNLLQERRQLPVDEVVELIDQVARGLEVARVQGIVHRDLKPHNLWLATQPSGPPIWKILDFGVSKLADHTGTLTQGGIVGTPAYMSPEQARSEDVDHRSDVYGLGAIAYRSLTGRAPFSGSDLAQLIHEVVYRMPPRPSDLAQISAHVEAVLAIALSKDPKVRFATALELAAALRGAASWRVDNNLLLRAELAQHELPWGA